MSPMVAGYSGGHAAVVGSVLVTNLRTGASKGGWESAEVLLISRYIQLILLVKSNDELHFNLYFFFNFLF